MHRKEKRANNKGKQGFYWAVLILFFLLISSSIGGFIFLKTQLTAVDTSMTDPVEFTINSGESVATVSRKLQQEGLIKNQLVFKYVIKTQDLGTKIQAGNFVLRKSMNLEQIAKALTKAEFEQVAVTLLEGWRREESAQELSKTLNAAGVNFDSKVFLSQPSTTEGLIFPDTYYFSLTTNEATVAKTIEANLNQKTAQLKTAIDSSPYTFEQILTMASIVEREARDDRAIVAGILWKRLENDWPLQADATLQYAKGYTSLTNDWWTTPLGIDKEIVSPYNTYANPGLPPAPICSPSLSSIEAAASPQETPYWFYITDNDGFMRYAETYDQHLTNINNYLR